MTISEGLAALLAVAALASGARAEESFRDRFRDRAGELGPELIAIAGGRFEMGNRPRDAAYSLHTPRHRVEVSPFALGRYEVTQGEYAAFLNDVQPLRDHASRWLRWRDLPGFDLDRGYPLVLGPAAREPMVDVTWQGALAYARWLSERTGRRYTLPTEAQWEYAARAGADSEWPWGDAFEAARVNCGGGAARALPSGARSPNRFGVHDLLGNVWEWMLDCHDGTFYLHSPARDPARLDPECATPVIRGGSFRDGALECSPGFRINYLAGGDDNIGFRVARWLDDHPRTRHGRRAAR